MNRSRCGDSPPGCTLGGCHTDDAEEVGSNMRNTIGRFRGAILAALAIVLGAIGTASVYAQITASQTVSVSQNGAAQATSCPPFQRSVRVDITPGYAATAALRTRSQAITVIEQVALRIDGVDIVVPAVAGFRTRVGSVSSDYYLPLTAGAAADPYRPLTLMQTLRVYADSDSEVQLSISFDSAHPFGRGTAVWSVSGVTCAP